MPISPPPYSGPKEVKYLFIDGGCLRASLKRISDTYAGGIALDIDYGRLTHGYSKVFYYDALPERKSGEAESAYQVRTASQRQLFDRLSSLDRFHVYEGDVRRSSSRRGPEQKKIDVMIAVDMLTHSFRRNMHEATLLTGDLDFKPLIDALVLEGMFVTLWYPPGVTAKELIAAADRSQRINVHSVYNALLQPAPFAIPTESSEPNRGDYAPILAKLLVDEREVKLMREGDMFVIAVPSDLNRGYVTYCKHSSLAIMRAYVKDMLDLELPKFSGEEDV